MEENVISNDDDSKRKRGDSLDDTNVYLTGLKKRSLDKDSHDDTKNSWFKGLHWKKSPEEAKYSDWSLDIKRELDNKTITITIEAEGGKDGIVDAAGVALKPFSTLSDYVKAAKETSTSVSSPTKTVITYSVHRFVLDLHSDYFKSILGKAFKESSNKRNTIELPAPVVTLQHFESLLDYCYTGDLTLDPRNAVAMIYFGDYLQIKELLEDVQHFIWNSIKTASSEDLLAYYRDAKGLRMEDLQKAIEHICAQRPGVMSVNTALSNMPDFQFWSNVWEARKHYPHQTVSSTRDWSDNLAHFTDQHHDIVDAESFRNLTHIDSLPIISPDAAVSLMEQEQELKLDGSTEANHDTLTCLQKRCTEALYNRKAGSWRVSKKDDLLERLKNLPSAVLDTILSWTMEDKRIPTGIEVSGAGWEGANGVYAATSIYNKKLMFTKQMGGGNKYTIFSEGSKEFLLSAFTRTNYIYHAEHKNEESSLPPKIGWGLVRKGAGASPPPTLLFMYD